MSTALIIVLALVVLFAAYVFYSAQRMKKLAATPQSDQILTLTDRNFQQKINGGLVLVDFWADWCMPCKVMGPVLNDVAESMQGKATVAKLNVDHFKSISSKYAIRNIPSLILFKNGKEVERFVGIKQKDFLIKQMQKHLS
ncbi:MAG: thioredoxin [Bacteroides sp.]|jgi:thioredoxin 1|nr:thioredoxin [Bacteroides sp.]